jgi:hypothetical protein
MKIIEYFTKQNSISETAQPNKLLDVRAKGRLSYYVVH